MTALLDLLDETLNGPTYYETLPNANLVRGQIERILRQNMSHRELQSFPELTDHMIDELEKLVEREVLDKADLIVGRLQEHIEGTRS